MISLLHTLNSRQELKAQRSASAVRSPEGILRTPRGFMSTSAVQSGEHDMYGRGRAEVRVETIVLREIDDGKARLSLCYWSAL